MKNRKFLGQHWLKDRQILDQIALLARPDLDENSAPGQISPQKSSLLCLEIGPGLGTLTSALFRQFNQVLAVELDDNLAKNLPNSFPGKNLTVKNLNFLDFDLDQEINQPFVVAANIPYYITSPIISKLSNLKSKPLKIVLLMQKEVAERITAKTGQHTLLSIITQNLADVKYEFTVSAKFFTPPPKVDSAVVSLIPRFSPAISDYAIKIASLGFSSPRKKLINNLSNYFSQSQVSQIFAALNLQSNARASDLSLLDWQNIADQIQLSLR